MRLKAGTRLKSAVCETQVMVIAAPEGELAVTCGGAPMLDVAADAPVGGALDAAHAGGTQIGKRYASADGALELLCTKAGTGALALGDVPLAPKEAKALPSSD